MMLSKTGVMPSTEMLGHAEDPIELGCYEGQARQVGAFYEKLFFITVMSPI